MIALDTNVLVRFLVVDDARQAALAAALIDRAARDDEELFVSDVVVCELVWVLSFAYKFTRPEISAALRDLLRARQLIYGASDQLQNALAAYTNGKGDFADYLIREQARVAGAGSVATFDKALLRERGFVAVA